MQNENVEAKRTQRYVDEVYRCVLEKPGVQDVVIINRSGVPIKTTMEREDALQYACLFENLREKSQAFMHKIDAEHNLLLLRVRTKLHEVIIAPDGKITVLVVQNAKDNFMENVDI